MSQPRSRTRAVRTISATAGVFALALTTAACGPSAEPTSGPTPVGRTTTSGATSGPPTTTTGSPTSKTPTAPVRTTTTPPKPSTAPKPAPSKTTPAPTGRPTSTPTKTAKPVPAPVIVLQAGDSGAKVRSLQARLRQIGWFAGDVSDLYGSRTEAAVRGFQGKRRLPATGRLDLTTWNRLLAMTHVPTRDELDNVKPKPPEPKDDETPAPAAMSWDVDSGCLTGRVMCISKTTQMLTWVIDGKPQYQFSVRFGSDELPTREGTFSVYLKKKDVISNLYHTPMPYSMFFSGGQAVHYSSNFARLGYSGASHGCVNVRDWNGIIRLYNESRVGDKVVVHW